MQVGDKMAWPYYTQQSNKHNNSGPTDNEVDLPAHVSADSSSPSLKNDGDRPCARGGALNHAGMSTQVANSMPGKSDEEMSKLAGQVLISSLAVPDLGMAGAGKEEGVEVEGLRDRVGRLSALLGLSRTPTREGLLKEAVRTIAVFSFVR